MTAPANKTMLNYFTKLPSKTCMVEETNPRRLAPAFNKQHVENFHKDKFDSELYLSEENSSINYIESIKSGQHKPFRIHPRIRGPLRSKLLQYCEDVRPPYFGTWQKKSARITGRRPTAKDEGIFDYEIDSEAEWDIGGPGESLKGDDSEDDEELDDYEIDMKTFVPHGYVSDDEIEVQSDQEENGSSSANQSIEEPMARVCDVEEDSNASIQIIGEKRITFTTISNDAKQQSNNYNVNINHSNGNKKVVSNAAYSPQQPVAMLIMKQPKLDIKPIILGVYYENQQATISESKINFLRGFQGFQCN